MSVSTVLWKWSKPVERGPQLECLQLRNNLSYFVLADVLTCTKKEE